MPVPSQRLQTLPPYAFAVIGQRIREMSQAGIDIIRIDIGNPDMPPADFVVDALHQSAQKADHHGYSGYSGTPTFRQAVARYYQKRFGVTLNPDTEVLPLLGSKEGLVNLALAYLDQGDVSLVPDVGYPSYAMGTRLAGADIYWVPMRPENGFLLDLDAIPEDVRERAKLLWINYPNNPTGAIASMTFLERVVRFCADNDILLVSDNPYVEITYDGYVAPSALEVVGSLDHTVEYMSFSKSHNMAGWRLGAAVGASKALKTLLQVKSNVDSGHFKAVYDAGIAALDHTSDEWMQERNLIYQNRRDMLMEALPDMGLEAVKSKATLYIWAKVKEMDATTYVEQALTDAHVSMAPGATYGPGGEDYVRISLSVPDERLKLAIERLKQWYATRSQVEV